MAGYNEIRGLRVKYLSADPSNAEDGQVWYNSTTGNLRVQGVGVSAWSSASPLSQVSADNAGAGSTSAGLAFGGTDASGVLNTTEEYNGSGWSLGGNLGTARRALGGTGTQAAGLAIGGYVSGPAAVANVEE